ncbi:MAG: hypothetical protein IJ071_03145 [Ruminococcus sp.]|nr:hypothetical protein [Ruminococcus sp.]
MSNNSKEKYQLQVPVSKLRPWSAAAHIGAAMHIIALVIFLGPEGGFTGGAIRVLAAILQIIAAGAMIYGFVNMILLKKKGRLFTPTELERSLSFGAVAGGGLLAILIAVMQLIFLTSSSMVLLMLFGGALALDGALYIYTVFAKD